MSISQCKVNRGVQKCTERYEELGLGLQRRGSQRYDWSQCGTKGYNMVCWGAEN